MARIRSVHPGLWTDERFASLSPMARLLFIGIWTECDDQGSFEWSPLKLKMRLLPADAVDTVALLGELVAAGCVISYELDARQLGAVRNFCRYQRPKKPNSTYLQTDAVRDFVGTEDRLTRDGSPPVRNRFPTDGEKSRQMEDGGGKREEGERRKKGGGAAASRGTRLARDFVVPPDWVSWAISDQGLSRSDAQIEAANFVDYWAAASGAKATKTDWRATWRVWCRRSERARHGGSGPTSDHDDPRRLGDGWLNSPC